MNTVTPRTVTRMREYRPTYMDGEVPSRYDTVRVDPLDRARLGLVTQVDGGRVFIVYHDDFSEPVRHWCSVDRCELVSRRRR